MKVVETGVIKGETDGFIVVDIRNIVIGTSFVGIILVMVLKLNERMERI